MWPASAFSDLLQMLKAAPSSKPPRREDLNSCGETSTWSPTYTGIRLRKSSEMPMISPEEKGKIFSVPGRKPVPETWSRGPAEPLFWQESKPIGLWTALLTDLNIKAVFDLSPGSGACAAAAMSCGIQYHGVCPGPRLR